VRQYQVAILNNFTVLKTTTESCYTNIYALVTRTIGRKFGKFYCIMHGIDEMTMPVVMATWPF